MKKTKILFFILVGLTLSLQALDVQEVYVQKVDTNATDINSTNMQIPADYQE